MEAFLAAAAGAGPLLRAPAVAQRWRDPSALGGYTVGGLAGHLVRAVQRLEQLLDAPPPDDPVVTVGAYYGRVKLVPQSEASEAVHSWLRDDGERMAGRGPAEVASAFEHLVSRLRERLPSAPPERKVAVLTMPGHAATLDGYLRTRVVEVVVHADDLAASVGLDFDPPSGALALALATLVEVVRTREGDLAVLRALCRQERAAPDLLRAL